MYRKCIYRVQIKNKPISEKVGHLYSPKHSRRWACILPHEDATRLHHVEPADQTLLQVEYRLPVPHVIRLKISFLEEVVFLLENLVVLIKHRTLPEE